MISEDKFFYFKQGKRASSIEELKEILIHMDQEEYDHHVMQDKNDFANWIENVFQEKGLAQVLRKNPKKEDVILVLDEFLEKKKIMPDEEHAEVEEPNLIVRSLDPKHEILINTNDDEPVTGGEQLLSEDDLQKIVNEAKEAIHDDEEFHQMKEEAQKERAFEYENKKEDDNKKRDDDNNMREDEKSSVSKSSKSSKSYSHKQNALIVKEFIYGFIFGLLFGLFLFGVLRNAGILT